MTTNQYRWLVAGQILGMCLLGLLSLATILGAVPSCRSKGHLSDAIGHYRTGTEASLRKANESLEQALGVDPDMPGALALRGRIAIEQGNHAVARQAYVRLQELPPSAGVSASRPLDGLGCVKLLEALNQPSNREQYLDDAYELFEQAIEEDPENDDGHVNAAVCSLHQGQLVPAAEHLRHVRVEPNLAHDTLIPYSAALGVLLATAAHSPAEAAVAAAYDETDDELATTRGMRARSVAELEKATALAGKKFTAPDLHILEALVKAGMLVSADYDRSAAGPYRNQISRTLTKYGTAMTRGQRRLLHLALAVSWARAGHSRNAHHEVSRALDERKQGELLSAEQEFYVGSVLLQAAESKKPTRRGRREAKQLRALAGRHLDAALRATPGRTPIRTELRFWALAQLAAIRHGKDPARALELAREAEQILSDQRLVTGTENKSRFFRNLGILQFLNLEREAARETLAKSLALDEKQKALDTFRKGIRVRRVVVDQIRAVPPETLIEREAPPTIPIISARVRKEPTARVSKADFQVYIGGELAALTRWSKDGRLYARARYPVAPEKAYEVRIVRRTGTEEIELARKEIVLTYEREVEK
ncbi:MAG: tetratricopeptide repeat protein [Planctomycetota bacterium]